MTRMHKHAKPKIVDERSVVDLPNVHHQEMTIPQDLEDKIVVTKMTTTTVAHVVLSQHTKMDAMVTEEVVAADIMEAAATAMMVG